MTKSATGEGLGDTRGEGKARGSMEEGKGLGFDLDLKEIGDSGNDSQPHKPRITLKQKESFKKRSHIILVQEIIE
jgi:hypothetical protein